jgi:signal transduction histidine kinase
MIYPEIARLVPASTLEDLPTHDYWVTGDTPGHIVGAELEKRLDVPGVMIEGEGGDVGLISRQSFLRQMSRLFSQEIYTKRPIHVMWKALSVPVSLLPGSCDISEAARIALDRPLQWVYEPLLVEKHGGRPQILDIHVLLLAQNVLLTQARQIEDQMRQGQKMEAIGQLAGGVAHDFNNLLTIILSNLSLVQDCLMPGDGNRDLLRDAEKAATRAANLTNQLLGFSRQAPLRLTSVSLHECIAETMRLLSRTIDPRITIEIEGDQDLWSI